MLRSILTLLVVFILIRLFFPGLAEAVESVLGLFLSILQELLSAAAGQIP